MSHHFYSFSLVFIIWGWMYRFYKNTSLELENYQKSKKRKKINAANFEKSFYAVLKLFNQEPPKAFLQPILKLFYHKFFLKLALNHLIILKRSKHLLPAWCAKVQSTSTCCSSFISWDSFI